MTPYKYVMVWYFLNLKNNVSIFMRSSIRKKISIAQSVQAKIVCKIPNAKFFERNQGSRLAADRKTLYGKQGISKHISEEFQSSENAFLDHFEG